MADEGQELQVEQSEAAEVTAPRTVEDFARDRGWRPKDEYGGNPDEWRDAETFIGWGLDRGRDMAKDLKQLRDTTDRMARTTASIVEDSVARRVAEARAEWERKLADAVEDKDQEAAAKAAGEIAKLAAPSPAAASPQNDPAVASFITDNPWFNSDPAARAVAIATADQAAARGLSIADQLKEAREAVHKRFAEYAPQPQKAPPGVAAPGTRQAPTGNRKKGFADLPTDAQAVARQLHAKGFVSSIEAYADQYFASKAA